MRCEEIRDEMIAYLKGELSEERKKEIEEHLARCQGCRREQEMAGGLLSLTDSAHEMSVVELADQIVAEAIRFGASDIHIDPTRDGADVRLRIDGVLQPMRQLTPQERGALVARFKLMGQMSVTECRLPQDGFMRVKTDDGEYDLRISVVPFLHGEKMVARLLFRGGLLPTLENLGFLPEQLESVRILIRHPCGVLYTSGPTGSGKTTTQYSILLELRDPEMNIMTIEDPIEMQLDSVQQAQVNRAAGFTFEAAMRGFLRQDPDIIMASEIRNLEMCELVVQAAMTGHFVLSSLYTQHAVEVPQRLLNIGIEPFLVGESTLGAISTVLARTICPQCREEYTPSPEALKWLGLTEMAGKTTFYHGAGCENCRGTGYRGRTALHEVLVFDREMCRMVSAGQADPNLILRNAIDHGFITMINVARQRVLEGITTAEELFRLAGIITSGPV